MHRPFICSAAAGLLISVFASACHSSRSVSTNSSQMVVNEKYLTDAPDRTFKIRYLARVKDVPEGTKQLRLWWPVPSDSSLQRISNLKFSGPVQPSVGREPKYGNQIAYVELANPPSALEFEMSFTCTRKEARVALAQLEKEGTDSAEEYRVFKEPDRLVVVDDDIRKRAEAATAGKTSTTAKARGIYDAVMAHMTYDKSGTGWGRGDTKYACDVGKGNCTDFHSLFNSMCRASGIASGFEIGLYLPYDAQRDGQPHEATSGYHCWAAFRVPGRTWVPVDISEADRFPERKDFFFGGHTANRVTLSAGRDLMLAPPQAGEPRNYLLDPYAEVDGKIHAGTSKAWFYQDL